MDETQYLALVERAFRRIGDGLENVDSELVDCDAAGDVVTLTFAGGKKCILNTQRPTRQIWMAANARAWHFSWDEVGGRWVDDKGRGDELFATLARVIKDSVGVDVALP
jgi:iron-sulfur cluster assembly protein CyaY